MRKCSLFSGARRQSRAAGRAAPKATEERTRNLLLHPNGSEAFVLDLCLEARLG